MLIISNKYESLNNLIKDEAYSVGANFSPDDCKNRLAIINGSADDELNKLVDTLYSEWNGESSTIPFRFDTDTNKKEVKIANAYKDVLGKGNSFKIANIRFKFGEGTINSKAPSASSGKLSATAMESAIAFAYNKLYSDFKDDYENLMFVTGSTSDNKLIDYYNANADALDSIASKMKSSILGSASAYRKLQKSECKLSQQWKDAGGTNKEPKTDIISNDNEFKVSVKKSHESQLMSGEMGETYATLVNVLNAFYNRNKKLREYVNKFMSPDLWTVHDSFANKDLEWTQELGNLGNNELKQMIKDLFDKFPSFRSAVLKEAASGELKFSSSGGGTDYAAANYMLTWSESGNCVVESVDEYIKSHDTSNAIKFDIRNKSHKDRIRSTSLRIDSSSNIDK